MSPLVCTRSEKWLWSRAAGKPASGGWSGKPSLTVGPWAEGGKAGARRNTSASRKAASPQRHRPRHKAALRSLLGKGDRWAPALTRRPASRHAILPGSQTGCSVRVDFPGTQSRGRTSPITTTRFNSLRGRSTSGAFPHCPWLLRAAMSPLESFAVGLCHQIVP